MDQSSSKARASERRSAIRHYGVITSAYWSFTLTDGALRMLVLLHFHQLGYSPLALASLFVLYELCGVMTNLMGGWLGGRLGLKLTLVMGLLLQVGALLMLSGLGDWSQQLQASYVLLAQGISGIAKDFTKISAKSAIKVVIPTDGGALFRWVAILTGSKNTLKGVGFFLGGFLLTRYGFANGLYIMAATITLAAITTSLLLPAGLGKAKFKAKFSSMLSKSRAVNILSIARCFLFGARDVWFVVGLPVYLSEVLDWTFIEIGTYMALWLVGYGIVQAAVPRFLRASNARVLPTWGFLLAAVPAGITLALRLNLGGTSVVVIGLGLFGVIFAINSAIHSYLILVYANNDAVSMDVGFYYMANAMGRLFGTVLSGAIYQFAGLPGCLLCATLLLLVAAGTSLLRMD